MNSSISRCDSSRCGTMTRSTLPSDFEGSCARAIRDRAGRACRARMQHRAIGGVERPENGLDAASGDLVGAARYRKLRLLVVQPRRRPDHDAMESVRALAAVGADHHADRQRRPIFERTQRAQIVGDALRQHRHDAVGEVDRVAARQRFAVERRSRPHIMRYVGDRHRDDMTARLRGSGRVRHARRRRGPWRRADRW